MDDVTAERWLPVVGHEGIYEVSDQGRVRAIAKILKPSKAKDGRLRVNLYKDGVSTTRTVYQLVAEAFIGPRPPGMDTRHLDDDLDNNSVGNLAYGDRSANRQDSIRNGNDWHLNRTECSNGHPYSTETIIWHRGVRDCKTCRDERDARWREANAEKHRLIARDATRRWRERKRANSSV